MDAKMKIDLSGQNGNAFYLMSMADKFGSKLGFSPEKINHIINEMKSSDYDNLIKTFLKNFGIIVELYKDGKLYE
jgi:hypothetical protein